MEDIKTCIHCKDNKQENLFHFNTTRKKYEGVCQDCWTKRRKSYLANNLTRNNLTKKNWSHKNSEKVKKYKDKWKQSNIGKVKLDKAMRKAAIAQATPKWLSPIQIEAMEMSYMYAQLKTECTGIKYHVDHVIPIKGKNVSGLNVPWNLETIPALENLKKGNKILPMRMRS